MSTDFICYCLFIPVATVKVVTSRGPVDLDGRPARRLLTLRLDMLVESDN